MDTKMKKANPLLSIFLTLLLPQTAAVAATNTWPHVRSVDHLIAVGQDRIDGDIHMSQLPVQLTQTEELMTPLEYYRSKKDSGAADTGGFGGVVVLKYVDPNNKEVAVPLITAVRNRDYDTMKEFLYAFKLASTDLTGFQIYGRPDQLLCSMVYFGPYATNAGYKKWSELMATNYNPLGETMTCGAPVGQWCAMTTPRVTFDYGTMRTEESTGKTLKEDTGVYCTEGMKFSIRAAGGGSEIALSNGQTATLTVNGAPLGTAIQGITGDQTLVLSSTLTGAATKTGPFTGSDVLYITYH